MNTKEIIHALRCSSSTGVAKCKKNCPYFRRASEEEINEFLTRHDLKREDFGDDFWDGCNCDKIAMDAADLIEKLTGGIRNDNNG